MKDLFDNVDVHNIVAFIKETHFAVDYNVVIRLLPVFILA